MSSQRDREQQLLEMMDACRPHSDDVGDPALAELATRLAADPQLEDAFSRLQKLDATLAGAFQDVPVPPGHAEGILARLAAASAERALAVEASARIVSAVITEAGVRTDAAVVRPARSRRPMRLWGALAAGAMALAVLLGVFLLNGRSEVYSASSVLENAMSFFNSELPAAGQLVSAAAPPWSYPYSPAVQTFAGARWRTISGFLGASGVAYDLENVAGVRATLYVVKRSIPDLGDTLPLRPALSSANCCVSAWQDRALVYVLVVRGDAAAYESFLDVPRWPVT